MIFASTSHVEPTTLCCRRHEYLPRTSAVATPAPGFAVSREAVADPWMDGSGWTVPGMLLARSRLTPDDLALWQLSPTGAWVGTTWSDYRKAAANLSSAFRKLGLRAGDCVGIMASSCKEWDFAQLGILAAGGVAVGLDVHGLDEHVRDISRRCQFAGLVLAHPEQLQRIDQEVRRQLRFVVYLDAAGESGVVELGALLAKSGDDDEWNFAQPDTPATIVFTSGSTGEPKGIVYTHRQMCLATAAILSLFPGVGAGSRMACWLPLSNLFQRMINLSAMGLGGQTYYVSDPREVMQYVTAIAPHFFIGVPRFFEKLHAGIEDAVAQQPVLRQKLLRWAWGVGDRRAAASRRGQGQGLLARLQFALADRLVLRRLRGVLGPNLLFMISGSAPMPVWLLERFHAMGLLVLEAYGLSENIIPVALNRPDCFRFGTVGRAVPGSEVRLADDGELLVRGPGVFSGYLGGDSASSPVDRAGYLASGDFATIDADGFITLVGRKSEIFKTSTGRRIAPASIESHLLRVAQLEYGVVFGASRPQPVALLVVTETAWRFGGEESFKQLRRQLAEAVQPLPTYQRPAGLVITAHALTIAGGEVTANMKLRRHVIEAKHAPQLKALYAHIDAARGAAFEHWSADHQFFHCSP